MNNKIKILRDKFKKYNIDGYIVPKNDDYFTEYSKVNRLKIISNFTGSAGIAVILKKKNYLFTDGRYTIQSQIESFEVKSYAMNTIETANGLYILLFVTVLQKEKELYECQEYQTIDKTIETLDMTLVCKELVQPYERGLGT